MQCFSVLGELPEHLLECNRNGMCQMEPRQESDIATSFVQEMQMWGLIPRLLDE